MTNDLVTQRSMRNAPCREGTLCPPGMLLSAKALLDENPRPTQRQVKEAIAGNLCRCTGYVKIVKAIMAAAEKISVGQKIKDVALGSRQKNRGCSQDLLSA